MFNFPDLPSVGDVYAPEGGPTWRWDGEAWLSLIVTPEAPLPAEVLGAQKGVGYSDGIFYDGAYTLLNVPDVQSLVGGRLYYTPYRIRTRQIFNRIGFNVSAPYSAINARVGIYKALIETSTEYPGALLYDAGEVSVVSPGVKEVELLDPTTGGGLILEPSEYWLVILLDGECDIYGNVASQGMYKFGSTLGPGLPYDLLFYQEYEYAPLPPTAGVIAREVGVFPNMSLRMDVDV